MNKTVLILGGSGFLGNYLKDYLSKNNLVYITSTSGINADFVFNVNNQSNLKTIIKRNNIEVIINCIVSYSSDFQTCFEVNSNSINNILKTIESQNIYFINISSIFADPLNNYKNAYSFTKFLGDEIINFHVKTLMKKYTILRFSQIFDKNGLAQKSQKGLYYFIDSVKNKQRVKLLGNHMAIRSYIPVELVCESIETAIINKYYGIHSVIMPDKYSNLNLIKLF